MRAESPSMASPAVFTGERVLHQVFLSHPHSLGESYWEHQRHAAEFGTSMIAAGVACLIHALVPALFGRTASTTIRRLHHRLVATGRIS